MGTEVEVVVRRVGAEDEVLVRRMGSEDEVEARRLVAVSEMAYIRRLVAVGLGEVALWRLIALASRWGYSSETGHSREATLQKLVAVDETTLKKLVAVDETTLQRLVAVDKTTLQRLVAVDKTTLQRLVALNDGGVQDLKDRAFLVVRFTVCNGDRMQWSLNHD